MVEYYKQEDYATSYKMVVLQRRKDKLLDSRGFRVSEAGAYGSNNSGMNESLSTFYSN